MQKQKTTVAKHSTHTHLPSLGLELERERSSLVGRITSVVV